MWAIFLIIAGIVLSENPEWFNGADTVGAFCLWTGIAVLVVWAVFFLIAVFAGSSRRW